MATVVIKARQLPAGGGGRMLMWLVTPTRPVLAYAGGDYEDGWWAVAPIMDWVYWRPGDGWVRRAG